MCASLVARVARYTRTYVESLLSALGRFLVLHAVPANCYIDATNVVSNRATRFHRTHESHTRIHTHVHSRILFEILFSIFHVCAVSIFGISQKRNCEIIGRK